MDFILWIIHNIVNEEVETVTFIRPIGHSAIKYTMDRYMPTNRTINHQNKQIQSVHLF